MPDDHSTAVSDELLAAREIIQRQQRSLEKIVLGRLEPVAIVGAGLRLPGGNDTLAGYDEFLRAGGAVTGDVLDEAAAFDARFFDIAPEVAHEVGAGERVLLETAWEAVEDAGIDPAALGHDSGGVYVAAATPDATAGAGTCSWAGRLSGLLGWRGPSLTTGTACASALTSLHLAVEGLRRRECVIALCGAAATTGCGVLVLKRLSDAWQDGDRVLAIVRGTAIGQDAGGGDSGALRAAIAGSRLAPGDIQYVEHHGHQAAAADVGAIVKAVLQLRAGVRYPDGPWEAEVRRAAVHGPTGAAVLEEAPRPPATDRAEPAEDDGHVFTLSAKSAPALRRQIDRYRRFLTDHPKVDLADLCHGGNVGRAHFPHRLAGGVRTRDELMALLDAGPPAGAGPGAVAFLFTGSGAEHVGMGVRQYDRFPEFRARVDECDKLFLAELGRSVTDIMFGRAPDAAAALAETRYAHAALFTLEYALAGLWRSWGVHPGVLFGHSVGEVVAATVAGVFSLADGVAFVSARAGLIESIATPGGMAAVAASAEQVAPVVEQFPDLAIAAVNSPRQCVLSGSTGSLMAAFMHLTTLGVQVRPLHVATGFHSPVLAEIAAPLRAVLDDLDLHEPTVPVVSSLTGKPVSAGELTTPDHWVRQAIGTVDFAAGVAAIGALGAHVFLELGPSHALTSLGRQCLPDRSHRWLASVSPGDATGATIRDTLAELYLAGQTITWPEVHAGQRRRRVELPLYAFDRGRHRLPSDSAAGHPLLGRRVMADDGWVAFESVISATYPDYLADCRADGRVVVPASVFVELLLALADVLCGDAGVPIEDVVVHEPLVLGEEAVGVRTRASAGDGCRQVEIACGERTLVTATLLSPGAGRVLPAVPRIDGVPDQMLDAGLEHGGRFRRIVSVARYGDVVVSELDGRDVAAAEFLPPPILDGVTQGLAADQVVAGIRRIRVFRKPRAERLLAFARAVRPGVVDAVLFEGDAPVAELSGVTFAPPVAARVDSSGPAVPSGSARTAAIVEIVRRAVAEVLSLDEVGADAAFDELGVDSLVVVDLRNRLESHLHLSFPIAAVYELGSVRRLAAFLELELLGSA